jgi:hypothetical protein
MEQGSAILTARRLTPKKLDQVQFQGDSHQPASG